MSNPNTDTEDTLSPHPPEGDEGSSFGPNTDSPNDNDESTQAEDVLHYRPPIVDEKPPTPLVLPERILVVRDFCVNSDGVKRCSECLSVCPKNAISLGEDALPHIDEELCSNCNICCATCDALGSNRITLTDLQLRIRRKALETGSVIITCTEQVFEDLEPAENVIVLPCLGMLSAPLLASVLTEGIKVSVYCDFTYCEDCDAAPDFGYDIYSASFEKAQKWTGCPIGFVDEIPEKMGLTERIGVTGQTDRRHLFSGIAGAGADVVSGSYRKRTSDVLQEFHARQERMRAENRLHLNANKPFNAFNLHHIRKSLWPHSRFLLETADNSERAAHTIDVQVSAVDGTRCEQDRSCIKACPTGARYADNAGNLMYEERYCVGCGRCIEVCPHNANSLVRKTLAELSVESSTYGNRVLPEDNPARDESATVRIKAAEDTAPSQSDDSTKKETHDS